LQAGYLDGIVSNVTLRVRRGILIVADITEYLHYLALKRRDWTPAGWMTVYDGESAALGHDTYIEQGVLLGLVCSSEKARQLRCNSILHGHLD
jgi:hypothetical protein